MADSRACNCNLPGNLPGEATPVSEEVYYLDVNILS